MDETKIIWTAFASEELDKIFKYLMDESKSIDVAARFIEKIFDKTDQLKYLPLSGQEEPYLKDFSVRYIVVSNYKIHYKYQENTIFITDIFHTKRNPDDMKK
jgi:toxin ParE1/3/4